jgi:hypothetical protein
MTFWDMFQTNEISLDARLSTKMQRAVSKIRHHKADIFARSLKRDSKIHAHVAGAERGSRYAKRCSIQKSPRTTIRALPK